MLMDLTFIESSSLSALNCASTLVAASFEVTTRHVGTWLRKLVTPLICKPFTPCCTLFDVVAELLGWSGCKNWAKS